PALTSIALRVSMCSVCYGQNCRHCSPTGVKCIGGIFSGGLCGSRDPGCTSTNRFAVSTAHYPCKGEKQTCLPGFEYATVSLASTTTLPLSDKYGIMVANIS